MTRPMAHLSPAASNGRAKRAARRDDPAPASRLSAVRMADVEPEALDWLWHHRIPAGKLSILAGTQGKGKSFITLDMAARISRGAPWPDLPDGDNPAGSSLLLSVEDGIADTIAPRLRSAGADLSKIHAVRGVEEVDGSGQRVLDLARDVHLLDQLIDEIGDVRLVVVDPVTAYIGGRRNANNDNEVREALQPLGALAERRRVAIVAVMHLRKAESDHALYRVAGSIGFTALARAVWLVADDEANQPDGRLVLCAKMNVAKPAPGLGFEVVDPGAVRWNNNGDGMTADDALGDRRSGDGDAGPAVREGMDWLRSALADGPRPAADLLRDAKRDGLPEKTLRRAKQAIGIVSENGGQIGRAWSWRLPDGEDGA